MTIRRANQLETNFILQISGNLMEESSAGYIVNNVHNGYYSFLSLIQNGAYYLIDEKKRMLRGWVLVGIDWNPMTGEVTGNLLHLYVFPEYRNAGIGKQLMQAAIMEYKDRQIETVQLNVYNGNPAKALYEKLGFKKISTTMELNIDNTVI